MVALLAYAGTWLAPVAARPALAVLAVSTAAAIGPIGALAVAIGSLAVPVPWSVRAALLVAAAINGALHAQRRRHGGCVTLVMLDLDRFKSFNDQHGHAAGNRLLNGVGQAITREKRDADIAARFGGEEFAVLVPGRAADGMIVAERMRRAISDLTPAPTSQRDFAPAISAS